MKRTAGFTLIELMVTIAIMAILFMIAAPSYISIMEKQTANAAINKWRNTLELAQSEALRLNRKVIICASDNGFSCKNAGLSSNNLNDGWIVGYEQAGVFHLIRDYPPGDSSLNLEFNQSGNSLLIFYSDGRLPPSSSGGTFKAISKNDKNIALCLVIAKTGRIRSGEVNGDECK